MKAVEVRQLSYAYSSGRVALSNIDFTLEEEESLGLIGPNGAGKTTLLLALCGLVEASGIVRVFGETITMKNAQRVRSQISFVFQNPDDQLFMPTVYEDVAFGLKELGCSDEEVQRRVRDSLIAVGLIGFEERSVHHCSFGEKRKITLSTALARKSRLLIFDEPTSELDPGTRREFIGMMKEIEATKIIASHDLNLVLETCTDILLINHGQVITRGKPEDLLANKELMESNRLEVPYLLQ